MITVLGATGYVGSAIADRLSREGRDHECLSRKDLDYTKFSPLLSYLRERRPDYLINAAGFTGKPNVDACEKARAETLLGNVSIPQTIAQACEVAGIPWCHVSSGCIYAGAFVERNGEWFSEKDLTRPELRTIVENEPHRLRGFSESDAPNFSFHDGPCSFYSGSKALGEEVLADFEKVHVCRLRIPFDSIDHPRNFLTKLQSYPRVYDNVNSISHRDDFARVCIELQEMGAPYGTYNVTNPGFITSRQVVEWIRKLLTPDRSFEFWEDDTAFYSQAASTPRSNCIMDVTKLLSTGIRLRDSEEAVIHALQSWRPSK